MKVTREDGVFVQKYISWHFSVLQRQLRRDSSKRFQGGKRLVARANERIRAREFCS